MENNMKKLILCLFFLTIQVSYSQWEKTNWRSDPEINAVFSSNNIILLIARGDLIISTDNGKNWHELNQKQLVEKGIYSIVFSDDNIYISTAFDGIFLSSDMGVSWQSRNNGLDNSSFVTLTIKNNIIYAATWGGGIYLSTDMSESWHLKNNGLQNLFVYKLAIKDEYIIASTSIGIFLSSDMGENWIVKNTGLPQDNYYFDELCIINDNVFIASHGDTPSGYENILYSSSDLGNTWVVRNNIIISDSYSYSMDAISDAIVIATFDNIYLSSDSGNTWFSKTAPLPIQYGLNSISIKGDDIFAALGGELYFSSNKGNDWIKLLQGQKYGKVNTMASINNNIFIGANEGWMAEYITNIYSSSDFGSNWEPKTLSNIEVNPLATSENFIVAGTQWNGCYISTDNGKNWQAKDTQDSLFKEAILSSVAIMGINIFVCNSYANGWKGRIFLSTDNGNSWSEKVPGLSGIHVLSLTVKDDKIYAGTEAGVFLSSDMGESWSAKNNGLPDDDLYINTIEMIDNNIYAGSKNGVYLSTNLGDSWQLRNNGLPTKSDIRKFTFSGKYIFICNWGYGVYLSSDNGLNWITKNDGLENLKVSTFSLIDDYIFVGTNSGAYGTIGNDAIFKAKISDMITDVKENKEAKSNIIFPNPAIDYIEIDLERCATLGKCGTSEVIQIFDMLGTVVASIHPMTGIHRINIENLSPGMYFIKIGNKVEKFIKM
jgi:photosystem II stability/assembly factor-like uncharacterized protein